MRRESCIPSEESHEGRERLLRLSHVRTSSHITDKTANRTARAEGQRKKNYFLWRCRLSSLRCLCLRIFFRRFLITLPKAFSPRSNCAVSEPSCGALERPRFRESRSECQGVSRTQLEQCPLGQRLRPVENPRGASDADLDGVEME